MTRGKGYFMDFTVLEYRGICQHAHRAASTVCMISQSKHRYERTASDPTVPRKRTSAAKPKPAKVQKVVCLFLGCWGLLCAFSNTQEKKSPEILVTPCPPKLRYRAMFRAGRPRDLSAHPKTLRRKKRKMKTFIEKRVNQLVEIHVCEVHVQHLSPQPQDVQVKGLFGRSGCLLTLLDLPRNGLGIIVRSSGA